MSIDEIRGKDAIEVLADIMEPASKILSDDILKEKIRANSSDNVKVVQLLLKSHPEEVLEIMAYLDGEDPSAYNPGIFVLPKKLMELAENEDLMSLFQSGGQNKDSISSGSALENTEGQEN